MTDEFTYFPVLRWKHAERIALRTLTDDVNATVTPLVEIRPKNLKTPDGGQARIDESLGKVGRELIKDCHMKRVLIDFGHVEREMPGTKVENGEDLLPYLLSAVRSASGFFSPQFIPVFGFGPAYKHAVRSKLDLDESGCCVRLSFPDTRRSDCPSRLQSLLEKLNVEPTEVDLVVDMKNGIPDSGQFISGIKRIPLLLQWRSFVLLAGTFPKFLNKFKLGRNVRSRQEWLFWKDNVLQGDRLSRKPSFGDYTIQHAVFEEPPGRPNPSVSVRYTVNDDWLVLKGEAVRKKGSSGTAQWPAHAQLLCESEHFYDAEYSEGDRYIATVAKNPKRPGSFETWIRAGINHHLTVVARQLMSQAKKPTPTVPAGKRTGHH